MNTDKCWVRKFHVSFTTLSKWTKHASQLSHAVEFEVCATFPSHFINIYDYDHVWHFWEKRTDKRSLERSLEFSSITCCLQVQLVPWWKVFLDFFRQHWNVTDIDFVSTPRTKFSVQILALTWKYWANQQILHPRSLCKFPHKVSFSLILCFTLKRTEQRWARGCGSTSPGLWQE